jgi:hypothetical protein
MHASHHQAPALLAFQLLLLLLLLRVVTPMLLLLALGHPGCVVLSGRTCYTTQRWVPQALGCCV